MKRQTFEELRLEALAAAHDIAERLPLFLKSAAPSDDYDALTLRRLAKALQGARQILDVYFEEPVAP